MAFTLGNYNIDEILTAVAQNFEGDILYSLDQLSSASIEISSESTEITDKKGNVVRTIYKTKTGTLTATNAFLNPQAQNAASGDEIEVAGTGTGEDITMPKIEILDAGASEVVLDDPLEDEIVVIGIYGNGANSPQLTAASGATPSSGKYVYDTSTNKLTLPAAGEGEPVQYLVKYDRSVTSGIKLSNSANNFANTVRMTLFCSYVDPCDDNLRPCYVVLPSFQPSPETTISLNADEQEMDFTGNLQVDYCSSDKALYYIYFPDEDIVVSGV